MFKQWVNDESGQAMSEYGLLLALVAVVVAGAVVVFRDKLVNIFTNAANSL